MNAQFINIDIVLLQPGQLIIADDIF